MSGPGFTTKLLTGVAELLAAAGVGAWRPDGSPYAAGETAIVLGGMPPDPARVVLLGAYPVVDDVAQPESTIGVQLRTRAGADPRDVQDLDDAAFDALQGLSQQLVGGVWVVQMYRRSSAALGQARDVTDRWERTSNYYAEVMRPGAHRPADA
ncbi:hypothetical protein GCM10018962_77100 [Dactylosporangium matsuzakiense]|uniref:minor capsid protein n=1 Tax=Dactylosporangium matsuzakiense TaxID=53360 RepID=UPI0031EFDF0A